MEFRRLGGSGLRVSAVGLGTNNFGTRIDEEASVAVMKEAIRQGITAIDTACSYGEGRSEQYIGRAIKGHRNDLIIMTKVGNPMVPGGRRDASRWNILRETERSLRRLGTDFIDVLQIHYHDPTAPIEETLRALDDLVRQGKVRYIGCSNYRAWQLCEALWTSRTLRLESYVSVQPEYSLFNRGVEQELLSMCQAYNVGVIPYFPLARGLLTGKYKAGAPLPEGTRLNAPRFQSVFSDETFETLGRLEAFASARGRTLLDLAFAWLLGKSQVSTVIAGATKPEQVQANARAASDWTLSADEMAELDGITKEYVTDPLA